MPVAFVLVSESCFADCLTQWHVCQRPCWGSKSLQPTGGWFPSSQGWGWGGRRVADSAQEAGQDEAVAVLPTPVL